MDQEINISTVYLDVFAKILNTKDSSILGVEDHAKKWEQIILDYLDIVQNTEMFIREAMAFQIDCLVARHDRIVMGVNMVFNSPLNEDTRKELLRLLAKDKVRINLKTDRKQEIKRIENQIEAIKVKISLKRKELDSITPESNEGKHFDAEKELYALENIIESSYKLKPNETTIKDYALRVAHANQIAKARKNARQ